jgi:sugar lactone lactonase YvrE
VSTRRPTVVPVPGPGAEDVVVATHGPAAGSVFTGTGDGAIWRVSKDGRQVGRVAETGGRPLGIEVDVDGRLLVCDDRVDGVRMVFCNNAAIAQDGTVWFSDSSHTFGIDDWRGDIAMATRSGRLLRRDRDGTVATVLDGLDFANGVALSADESYVAVAESGGCTVVRHWLTGPRAGSRDLLVPELPGYPDNIARGSDGLIWVAIASPQVALAARVRSGPRWLRTVAAKAPARLQPRPIRSARVQAYDDGGSLVHDLQLPHDEFSFVTGVREHDGRVWLGSLEHPAIAFVDL